MRIKSLSKMFIIVSLCIILLTMSGVFATWYFSLDQSPEDIDDNILLGINDFYWDGAEQLPESDKVGENHIALIERMTLTEFGLNNSTSFLSEYIQDRIDDGKNNASSVAPTPGGNLKTLFNTPAMALLDFMIYFTFDENNQISSYDIFTFETALIGNQQDQTVYPVYKTTLVYSDGMWKAATSKIGTATTIRYDVKQGGVRITINPTSWFHTPQ